MKAAYNRKAIMQYAHRLFKMLRDADWSYCLRSAWLTARQIRNFEILACGATQYQCDFPVVVAPGVTCVAHKDPFTKWVDDYGAE
jgi:hypothetical protein